MFLIEKMSDLPESDSSFSLYLHAKTTVGTSTLVFFTPAA